MNRSLFFRTLFLCLLLLVGLSAVQAQSDNLLTNPGFESPFNPIAAGSTSMVAQGWTAWSLQTGNNLQPEDYAATNTTSGLPKPHIHSGSDAQEYFTFFAPHIAGVYQTVSGITSGADLTFSVYAYVWVTSGNDPDKSDGSGALQVQVGIDPTGGTDPTSSAIVWSAASPKYDEYDQYSVTTAAQGDSVTVFVRSSVTTVAMNNAVYLDDASLTASGAGGVAVTAEATSQATTEATQEVVVVQPTEATTPEIVVVQPTEEISAQAPVTTQEVAVAEAATAAPPTAAPTEAPPTVMPTDTATEVPPTVTPTNTATEVPPTATDTATEVPATATSTDTSVPPTPTPSPTLNTTVFPYTIPYTVQRGDTVGQLATRFNTTVEAIIIVNQLSPDAFIYETQQILIPVQTLPTATQAETEAQQPTATPTESVIVVQPAQTQTEAIGMTVPGTPTMQRYVVRYGDTLSTIAHLFGVSLRDLAHANGIVNPNLVYVGQVLRIPVSGTPTLTPSPTPVAPTATQIAQKPQYYTVRPGDNLYRISILFNVPIGALMQVNGIYDANYIFVGEILVIP